ncbi:MAG: aspartate kinase [Nannocystaceae bacterium]
MLVVQKYGGTSVGSLPRIRAVAERCLARQRQGCRLIVVVSAMAGETDRLITLANDLLCVGAKSTSRMNGRWVEPMKVGDRCHERELSQLVSTGEKMSAALLSMAIQDLGGAAMSFVGHQLGLQTDRRFTDAHIMAIEEGRFTAALEANKIVVCAGFQGVDPEGNITTLGRGGTDTSAVAVAAALHADACEILTDVDGVYTSDPRVVPNARKLDRISYEAMLELAGVGAKVLHIRSVAFAMKYRVPLHVRSSLNRNEGTWIVPEEKNMESVLVTGVALDRNEAKVTLADCPDQPGTIAAIFAKLAEADVLVDMIIQNASRQGTTDVTFTVPKTLLDRSVELLANLPFVSGGALQIHADPNICKISIVGVGMRTHAGVASRAFSVLAEENVNVEMVSTSEIKVSVVVQERYGELATRALHDAFGLAES